MPIKKTTHAKAAEKTEPQFLTIAQVATLMNVSQRTVNRWVDAGSMPKPMRLGHVIRWNRTVIDQWIETGCTLMA
jgi:excisionase family DNA binding protein